MTAPTRPTSTQVTRYLDQLAKELTSVPKQYRAEVIEGIRAHIQDALERGELDATTILDQLGTPEAVAAEALDDFEAESGRFARPTARGRKLQAYSFALALLVALLGSFLSFQPDLTVPILLSSIPPLVLTIVPLLTRGPRWLLVSGICATVLALFLVTAITLSFVLGGFSFPLTFLLVPMQTWVFYIPMLTLAILPLFMRRR